MIDLQSDASTKHIQETRSRSSMPSCMLQSDVASSKKVPGSTSDCVL